jgi:arylsulfatase A-like enzyme
MFSRRCRLLRLLPLLSLLAAVAASARPNLLFILTDDQRWDTLGAAGNAFIPTPHLDRLAREGTRFANAFVTTSICSVSRASIFSGQHARRHGIEDFARTFTPARWAETYPARLRAAGYHTGFIGKFGVGDAAAVGAMEREFDFWRGRPGQGGPFVNPDDRSRTHATARMGDEALEFLRAAPPGRPWCLSVSFTAPHARDGQPREFFPTDPRDDSLFQTNPPPAPPLATAAAFAKLHPAVQRSEARTRWERRFATPERAQETRTDYARLIAGVDREVGRLRAALAELGPATNTVIVFTSDNGFYLGDRGLSDKWFMHEESIRVPLLVADLRRPARGQVRGELSLNIDVAPTLLDYAGLEPSPAMQGRSLRALVEGRRVRGWRTDFLYEHHFSHGGRIPRSEGVRTARWSWWRWLDEAPPAEELYDLRRDPGQQRNLAADPRHRRTLEILRARWAALSEEVR